MHTINWVDLIMVAIIGLGVYSARKSEMITEIVVLLGIVFSACFSLHFYTRFGVVINKNIVLPPNTHEVLAYIIINVLVIGVTLLTKGGWLIILKINVKREIDHWVCRGASFIKSVFLCSIVLITLVISGRPAFESAAKKSFSYVLFRMPAFGAYSIFYNGFISPFFKGEPLNEKAFRSMQS